VTSDQKAWADKFKRETGFDVMYDDELSSGANSFYAFCAKNLRWFEEWASEAHRRAETGMPHLEVNG
jgi:hypothetical protein